MQKVSFVWINAMAICALLGCLCTPAQAQEEGGGEEGGTGACCFADGSCQDGLNNQDCFDLGGIYSGDNSLCAVIECTGACCLIDDTCIVMSESDCDDAGGEYQGDGIDCYNGQCLFLGACCLIDGTTHPDQITFSECEDLGGEWQGFDTDPGTTTCTGACCFDDGECLSNQSQQSCIDDGGEFLGEGTNCPPEPCYREVQCFDDFQLSPLDDLVTFDKFDTEAGTRELSKVTILADGEVVAVNLACNNNDIFTDVTISYGTSMQVISANIPPPPFVLFDDDGFLACGNPPPTLPPGACCDYDSPFRLMGADSRMFLPSDGADFDEFIAMPGDSTFIVNMASTSQFSPIAKNYIFENDTFVGYEICVIYEWLPLGACCLCDGTCLPNVTEEECESNPLFVEFFEGQTCAEIDCQPIGVCCLCTGECIPDISEEDCLAHPDFREFTPCASCDEVECEAVGSCCLCDGQCFEDVTEAECNVLADDNDAFVRSFVICGTCDEPCIAQGACCLCTGECIPNLTEAECTANPDFVSWNECETCDEVFCPPLGSCCLCDGQCFENVTQEECDALADDNDAFVRSFNLCGTCDEPCIAQGACCLCTGECIPNLTEAECTANPDFVSWNECETCDDVVCPALGSCCLCTGQCFENVTQEECDALADDNNAFVRSFDLCGTCDEPCIAQGACCLCTGECIPNLTEEECFDNPDAVAWHECAECTPDLCPAIGACCLCPDGCMENVTQEECLSQPGTPQFFPCAGCDEIQCCCGVIGDFVWKDLNQNGCQDANEPGINGVTVRLYDAEPGCPGPGNLIATTTTSGGGFYEFTNLCAGDYRVVFVAPDGLDETIPNADCGPNSDESDSDCVNGQVCVNLPADDTVDLTIDCGLIEVDEFEPGWNWVDNLITLTGDQPVYWSAATGLPAGLSPWAILDPDDDGSGPGRLDPEGSGQRVLRGFVVAFAVDQNGDEIRWNHLAGNATVVDYLNGALWEYNAWPFPVVDPGIQHGQQTGTPGVLNMDGNEYAYAYDQLLLNFQAVNSAAYSSPRMVTSDTDLTLHPLTADLRQETDGPVFTKAEFTIWNENEVKFSGAERCIACWDQFILSQFDAPNHFLMNNLQTDHGKARINGIGSQVVCGPDAVDAALLGVSVKELTFDMGADFDRAGTMLHGMGTQSAVLQFDSMGGTPESQQGKSARQYFEELLQQHQAAQHDDTSLSDSDLQGDILPISGGLGDRVSGTEKGSLLFYSAVEVRWDQNGEVIQDTFLQLTNDLNAPVMVQMYFVNGDDPVGSP